MYINLAYLQLLKTFITFYMIEKNLSLVERSKKIKKNHEGLIFVVDTIF